jgi:hypothetical protein
MRMASERGGSKGGIPVSLQDVSSAANNGLRRLIQVKKRGRQRRLSAGELFHHQAGAAASDVGHDGSAPMNFRDQT